MSFLKMLIAQFSLAGPRGENQDTLFSTKVGMKGIFAFVADGVGGMGGGKAASLSVYHSAQLNIEKLNFDPASVLILAHELVNGLDMPTAATTASVIYFDGEKMRFAHTGDSRICVVRGAGLKTLTVDQTEATLLVNEGVLTKKAAKNYHRRNVLTHAIEKGQELELLKGSFDLMAGDIVFLLTDGIYKLLSKVQLRDLTLSHDDPVMLCSAISDEIKDRLVDDASLIAFKV